MTKRRLETNRELTERWLNIQEDLLETGKLICVLECEDDLTTARKIKKLIYKHMEDIRQYYREVIEPIRASIERVE